MFRTWYVVSFVASAASLLASPCATVRCFAQTSPPDTAQRLALARARTDLLEQVRKLPLSDGRSIRAWAATRVEFDRALRRWIRRQPPHGAARARADGQCEIEVLLTPEALRDQLLVRRTPPDSLPADLPAAGMWPTLRATGRALPGERVPADCPAGWEDVTPEGRRLAEQAALAEAHHALLEQAGRVRVTPAYRLRDFLNSSPAVRDAVLRAISQQSTPEVCFDPGQVCVARVRLAVPSLVRILMRVHADQYEGDVFKTADFRDLAVRADRGELSADGLAPPPNRTILGNPAPPRAKAAATQPTAATTRPVKEHP